MTRIIIGGDFCPTHNDVSCTHAEMIADCVKESDLRIYNFECSIASNGEQAIKKEGPTLYCSEKQFEQIEMLSPTLVTLANNHVLDSGAEGLRKLFACCKDHKIDYVGAGDNIEEASKIYIFKNIAIINCCEEEFSIADKNQCGANPMRPISIYNQICDAKNRADCVIVIAHGGVEYYQFPSPNTQDLYRFFIDAGASAVVGHHPHCFSGFERYHGGYIYYSLGNLFFDNKSKKHTMWNDGFLLKLDVDESGRIVDKKEIPYIQCCQEPGIVIIKGGAYEKFHSEFADLNSVIAERAKLEEKYEDFVLSKRRNSLSRILPYSNRILTALYKRGYIPSMLNSKMVLSRLNAIRCQSHRDMLVKNLEELYRRY